MSRIDKQRRVFAGAWRPALLLAVLVFALAPAGCFRPLPPDSDPAVRGVIVDISPGAEGGTVRVVWHESLGEVYDLDSLDAHIGEETDIFDREGAVIGFADLVVRDVVDVWVSGAVAESYPPQATPDAVRVIGTFDDMRPLPVPPGLE